MFAAKEARNSSSLYFLGVRIRPRTTAQLAYDLCPNAGRTPAVRMAIFHEPGIGTVAKKRIGRDRRAEVQTTLSPPLFSIIYNQFLVRRLQRRSTDWTLTKSTTFLIRAPCRLQDFIEDKQFRQLGINSSTWVCIRGSTDRTFCDVTFSFFCHYLTRI
jgi:hypothetical protein